MGRQKLEQKTLLNLTPQQIQFLNLLQTPLIALEKRIEKELEENPALEEDLDKDANALEKAVQDVLNDGLRTKDIISKGKKEVSTSQMGDAIISKLQ